MAEIIRSGILSVAPGQRDAVKALSIPAFKAFCPVTLPQAMRIIIPTTGSTIISNMQATSLVSVIAGPELLTRVENIRHNLKTLELLIVACIWYLIISSAADLGQYFVERKFGRGYTRAKLATTKSKLVTTK